MPLEKSAATTRTPDRARASLEVPVPAARSRIRSPGRGATARTVAIRHSAALPPDSTALVMSYRRETRSNIAATSAGFLVRSAEDTLRVYFEGARVLCAGEGSGRRRILRRDQGDRR